MRIILCDRRLLFFSPLQVCYFWLGVNTVSLTQDCHLLVNALSHSSYLLKWMEKHVSVRNFKRGCCNCNLFVFDRYKSVVRVLSVHSAAHTCHVVATAHIQMFSVFTSYMHFLIKHEADHFTIPQVSQDPCCHTSE